MQAQRKIIDCYDKTAKNYAKKFIDELQHKHLDRILLRAFATENKRSGKLIDLGCGPGQASRFLNNCGLSDITGIDLSPEMISLARQLNPGLHFETGNMLRLKYRDESFSSAIAFYSIVHFTYGQLKTSLEEIKRILRKDGQFLFSFHVGKRKVHLNEFLGEQVDIDFHFFDRDRVAQLLEVSGFDIVDLVEREPYQDIEYPSKRAYIWVKKK